MTRIQDNITGKVGRIVRIIHRQKTLYTVQFGGSSCLHSEYSSDDVASGRISFVRKPDKLRQPSFEGSRGILMATGMTAKIMGSEITAGNKHILYMLFRDGHQVRIPADEVALLQ